MLDRGRDPCRAQSPHDRGHVRPRLLRIRAVVAVEIRDRRIVVQRRGAWHVGHRPEVEVDARGSERAPPGSGGRTLRGDRAASLPHGARDALEPGAGEHLHCAALLIRRDQERHPAWRRLPHRPERVVHRPHSGRTAPTHHDTGQVVVAHQWGERGQPVDGRRRHQHLSGTLGRRHPGHDRLSPIRVAGRGRRRVGWRSRCSRPRGAGPAAFRSHDTARGRRRTGFRRSAADERERAGQHEGGGRGRAERRVPHDQSTIALFARLARTRNCSRSLALSGSTSVTGSVTASPR